MKQTQKHFTPTTFVNITDRGICGQPSFQYGDTEARPSWKRYGTGTQGIEFRMQPSGHLSIDSHETPEGDRGKKETMITLPPAAIPLLREWLQQQEQKGQL